MEQYPIIHNSGISVLYCGPIYNSTTNKTGLTLVDIITNCRTMYQKSNTSERLCAYRKKYGTEHILIKLIDSWKFVPDENKYAGTVLMDLSKALDCVSYGLLIAKMHAYGLSTNACEFMSSYLSDRYQRVKISKSQM